jgi:hypothetical protein
MSNRGATDHALHGEAARGITASSPPRPYHHHGWVWIVIGPGRRGWIMKRIMSFPQFSSYEEREISFNYIVLATFHS